MPSGTAVTSAAPIIAPSTKLCTAPPMSTSVADVPCTAHSSVWQWRQSTSFSRTKNRRMPASSVPNTRGAGAAASASGSSAISATPSSAPTA